MSAGVLSIHCEKMAAKRMADARRKQQQQQQQRDDDEILYVKDEIPVPGDLNPVLRFTTQKFAGKGRRDGLLLLFLVFFHFF